MLTIQRSINLLLKIARNMGSCQVWELKNNEWEFRELESRLTS